MYVWNSKYDIEQDELEDKISEVVEELDLCPHEIISDLDDLKSQHEDWDVDMLINEVRKIYITE